jgi:hypothetical protein
MYLNQSAFAALTKVFQFLCLKSASAYLAHGSVGQQLGLAGLS